MNRTEKRVALLKEPKGRLVQVIISLGNDVKELEDKALTDNKIMSGLIKKIKELEGKAITDNFIKVNLNKELKILQHRLEVSEEKSEDWKALYEDLANIDGVSRRDGK